MIYADYNGSSPLIPSVKEYLKTRMESELFANPNAIHSMSQKLYKRMEKSREIIADVVGCYPDEIFFNSGASEGISQIIHSILENSDKNKNIILSSPVEHSVIPNTLAFYEKYRGFTVKYLDVDENGVVEPKNLERLLLQFENKVAMVTVMAANNETGAIQPFEELQKICQQHHVEYFSDTTQIIGKMRFNFNESGLNYAVCSGHKIGALSGSGFLIAREPSKLLPLVFGSTQEKGLRGGTQHYLGIETLALAVKELQENMSRISQLNESKIEFEKNIKNDFPQVVIIGEHADRLAGTTLLGYPGIHGQAVQIELESHNIFVTTSAACTDNQPETSKVLKAMGVNDNIGRSVIRISLGHQQGKNEYDLITEALKTAYNKLSKIQSY